MIKQLKIIEDTDDLGSTNDLDNTDDVESTCLICFTKSNTRRQNLPKYICTCNYPIHADCFKKWKYFTTGRLCIICEASEEEYYHYNYIERRNNDLYNCLIKSILVGVSVYIFLSYTLGKR